MGKTQKPFVDFIASEASIRSSSTRFMTFQRSRSNGHDRVSLSEEELIPREKLLKFATNIPRRERQTSSPTYLHFTRLLTPTNTKQSRSSRAS